MAVMVQIRNVPEDLHRKLKARGRACWHVDLGVSPPGDREVARASHPEELPQRLRQHGRVNLSELVAKAVAAERESR